MSAAGVMKSVVRAAAWLALALAAPAFGATVEYLHTDALGSVVAVSNSAGMVVERREYEPYGRQLKPPVLEDGPAYTGHVSDAATGLSYMQQRYYDPGVGRFLSVDPVTASDNNGGNFNRYKYVSNNPYKFVDPDGRTERCPGSTNPFCVASIQINGSSSSAAHAEHALKEKKTSAGQVLAHEYGSLLKGGWPICKSSQEWCSQDNGFAALSYYAFPGQDNSQPVADGQLYEVRFLGKSAGHIQVRLNAANFSITNITRSDHLFCCGYVTRSVAWQGDSLMLRTYGSGTNSSLTTWALNYITWRPGFNQYNHLVQMKMIELWSEEER